MQGPDDEGVEGDRRVFFFFFFVVVVAVVGEEQGPGQRQREDGGECRVVEVERGIRRC